MRKTGTVLTTACLSGTAGAQGFTAGFQAPVVLLGGATDATKWRQWHRQEDQC